jgi:hypothetical protein
MKPPAETNTTERRRIPVAVTIGLLILLVVSSAVATPIIAKTIRGPSEADVVREQNHIHFLKTWGAVWPWASVALFILIILFAASIGIALVRWLNERSTSVYPSERGILPVKALKVRKWVQVWHWLWLPAQDVVFHDPNRAPGATTVYSAAVFGVSGQQNRIEVKQFASPVVSKEQLQVTAGAQLTQIAAAAASSDAPNVVQRELNRTIRGQLPNVSIYNDMDRPLVAPQVPEPSVIEGSHIQRVLEMQGEPVPLNPQEGRPSI